MSAVQDIEKKALALPIRERVQLAESLLDSLALDQVWSDAEDIAEVERRERQIESGEVKPLSEAEFLGPYQFTPQVKVEYHPAVEQDVAEIKKRYKAASPKLQNCAASSRLQQRIPIASTN